MNIAIVACRNIAARYSEDVSDHSALNLAGFYDIHGTSAEEFASQHGGGVHASLDVLLADASVTTARSSH